MSIYTGAGKLLEDIDLPRIGDEIGVGEDVLHALLEVETRGHGFDDQGRLKMLFEPHKFYAHLHGDKRQQAVSAGLAYPHQGERPYPRDSYPHLEKAMAIDSSAALMSASWGLPQVMGENYHMLGFSSVEDMVGSFAESEANQIEGMVKFIRAAGIDDDLRRIQKKLDNGQMVTAADWVPAVRAYNGPKFRVNQYDARANAALHKWMKIKDTPWAKGQDIRDMASSEEDAFSKGEIDSFHKRQAESASVEEPAKPDDSQIKQVNEPPAHLETSAPKQDWLSRWSTFTLPAGAATVLGAINGFVEKMPAWAWVALIGIAVIVGGYLFNESKKRNHEKALANQNTLSDPNKNNVVITK
jgi:hypothetical protein